MMLILFIDNFVFKKPKKKKIKLYMNFLFDLGLASVASRLFEEQFDALLTRTPSASVDDIVQSAGEAIEHCNERGAVQRIGSRLSQTLEQIGEQKLLTTTTATSATSTTAESNSKRNKTDDSTKKPDANNGDSFLSSIGEEHLQRVVASVWAAAILEESASHLSLAEALASLAIELVSRSSATRDLLLERMARQYAALLDKGGAEQAQPVREIAAPIDVDEFDQFDEQDITTGF